MPRFTRRRVGPLLAGILTSALVILGAVLLAGGYFESRPYALAHGNAHSRLAAVYWSGDMGMRLGVGRGVVDALTAHGIPVLTVSSPMLFGEARDRAFVDGAVASSIRTALERTGAEQVAVIGNSFGADILGAGLGRLPADLRKRIASVVLTGPGTYVYFHANPTGIWYRGPVAAEPAHTIPLLRGLPVTCIYGTEEDDSLCETPIMASSSRVPIADGHLMLWSTDQLHAAVVDAVFHPPLPMR
jgi:hypothetical protein